MFGNRIQALYVPNMEIAIKITPADIFIFTGFPFIIKYTFEPKAPPKSTA